MSIGSIFDLSIVKEDVQARSIDTILGDAYPDIGSFDFLKNILDKEFAKSPRFQYGELFWEKTNLSKDRLMEIGRLIMEIDDTNASYEEKIERVAFKLIGMDYMESIE